MALPRTDRSAQKRSGLIRRVILGAALFIATGLAVAHQYPDTFGFKSAGVDALCPFGGVETLYSLATGGTLLQRLAVSSVVLLVGAIVLALLFRRSFCGQLCPLGALQGAFGWLRRKITRKQFEIPKAVDRFARYLKYVVLVGFGVATWWFAELVIRPYDAWAAWAHLSSPEVFAEFGVGLAVLGVSLAGSFVYDRFFCKYLCPMGAFLGIFSKVSLFGIRRDAATCIDCGKCDRACPMNVSVAKADVVTSSECISCTECVNACPVAGALEVKTSAGSSKAIRPLVATGIVVALFLGIVAAAGATGNFSLTQPTVAEAVEQAGGTFDTSLIKGSSPLAQIAEATGIPRESFASEFGVPDAELDRPIKDIKDQYGFTPEDVRTWVAAQLGIEVTPGDGPGGGE